MLFFLKQRKNAVGVSSNKLVQSHTVSPFWRTSTLHPEKIHVSHGQQDQLCQQKCSVPCSGPPLPNDLPENPRNRGLKWGKSQGLQGVPTVELWNRGTWVTLAFAPSWLNWEPPPGGVERVWPRKGVESWGSWCFNGNWELGGFSTQPTNLPPLLVSNTEHM